MIELQRFKVNVNEVNMYDVNRKVLGEYLRGGELFIIEEDLNNSLVVVICGNTIYLYKTVEGYDNDIECILWECENFEEIYDNIHAHVHDKYSGWVEEIYNEIKEYMGK